VTEQSGTQQAGSQALQARLRADVAHSARIYDYLLGGKDNFASDRAAAAAIVENLPHLPTSMRANRRFLVRVGRYLSGELGLRQFLDIGTGLPTSPNLHEVVQQVAADSRVVYVDNDPLVLVHARALLTSSPQGRTAYLDADLLDPDRILSSPVLRETLDLAAPVALSLLAILQFIQDDGQAKQIIDQLMAALPPSSALVVSTVTGDSSPEQVARAAVAYRSSGIPTRARSRAEVEALVTGLRIVDPGVVLVHRWHPDELERDLADEQVFMYGVVALKG
jgi:S-adenosyl methyltransferase